MQRRQGGGAPGEGIAAGGNGHGGERGAHARPPSVPRRHPRHDSDERQDGRHLHEHREPTERSGATRRTGACGQDGSQQGHADEQVVVPADDDGRHDGVQADKGEGAGVGTAAGQQHEGQHDRQS